MGLAIRQFCATIFGFDLMATYHNLSVFQDLIPANAKQTEKF